MFIYREDYYIPDTEDKNIAEIIIDKTEKRSGWNRQTGMDAAVHPFWK